LSRDGALPIERGHLHSDLNQTAPANHSGMVRQVEQIARFDAALGDGDASPVITQMLNFNRARL
jgi:hypothetical protein